jgi:hypothetical protein
VKIGDLELDDNSVKQFIGEQALVIDILKAQLRKMGEELKEIVEKRDGRLVDTDSKQ